MTSHGLGWQSAELLIGLPGHGLSYKLAGPDMGSTGHGLGEPRVGLFMMWVGLALAWSWGTVDTTKLGRAAQAMICPAHGLAGHGLGWHDMICASHVLVWTRGWAEHGLS